jgi:hypothetical protein
VDAKTRGVVTVSSNTVTQPTTIAAAPSFTQQGRTRPQRPSAREFFPLVIPDADWWKTCDRDNSDLLTTMTTKCDVFKDIVNCQQLASMGYLPSGIQSFVPSSMHGGFTIPNGCSTGNLGVEYDGLKMVFNSPQTPIMAVIAKDIISKVFYFGSGVTQVCPLVLRLPLTRNSCAMRSLGLRVPRQCMTCTKPPYSDCSVSMHRPAEHTTSPCLPSVNVLRSCPHAAVGTCRASC